MPADELQPLKKAVDGLTYPSESDEPFEAFVWKPAGAPSARDAVVAHGGKDRAIAQVAVEQFFSQLDDTDDAKRYRALQKTLQSTLADLAIFRVGEGEVRVDVYLVGKTHAGNWAGLHTVSIET
ncbi:MAG TPA: nuclease A inhibitor family protein [Tepidisphaeraceae bacterium]|nr:nuclease A inhibitor family protein [Tepidisphaeraceae bacterium]